MIAEVEERHPVRRSARELQCKEKSDATITSVLSDNSSLAPLCREHPSDGKDESTTAKCSGDGIGLVKNLSGRLARKLQRSASLVNAGLSEKIRLCWMRQSSIDVILSTSARPTEAMQQRGISSFSLLRSGGAETTTHRHMRDGWLVF